MDSRDPNAGEERMAKQQRDDGSASKPRASARKSAPIASDATSYDPVHDPGTAAARARAERLEPGRQPTRIVTSGSEIRFGTASWTDPTMTAPGVFYPDDVRTPETRLRYYASVFPFVEVDSTYYALPKPETAALWAARTPDDFVFDIKAHALMTGHPTETSRLPREIRDALPEAMREAKRIYPKDLPSELLDAVWTTFLGALAPLREAGKLGAVLMQYPPWFVPTRESAAELERVRERLGDVPGAVEFRQPLWLSERLAPRTEALLSRLGLIYVSVDEPQGTAQSVPPTTLVTHPGLAIVRLHGRRLDTWTKRGAAVQERFRYLYSPDELSTWAPTIASVAGAVERVHVVFNNCYGNYGTTNALEMSGMVASALMTEG
jgi:uncharacterized protein YecE (DUF72 family)